MPTAAELVAGLADAEAVSAPGRRWHYSNLAYAPARRDRRAHGGRRGPRRCSATCSIRSGSPASASTPGSDAADGYLVEPYTDVAHVEPRLDAGGFDPAGCLWGTALDVARFMAFLDRPDPAVLAPATADELCEPQAVVARQKGDHAWGLGVELVDRGGTVDAGHLGGMPGFLTAGFARRGSGAAAAVLGNSGTARRDLRAAARAARREPRSRPAAGRAVGARRAAAARARGRARPLVVGGRRGDLRVARRPARGARGGRSAATLEPAVFAPAEGLGPDVLRTVSGREAGELLRLTRDADGRLVHMHWATYRLTREQRGFARS